MQKYANILLNNLVKKGSSTMVTTLGKELRILRIKRNELLKDMADRLGIAATYLSAIENGKRQPSKDFVYKLSKVYDLSQDETEEFEQAYFDTINEISIPIDKIAPEKRDLGLVFARRFNELDTNQINKIMEIMRKGKEKNE